jgi:rod shape-determining protein MreC
MPEHGRARTLLAILTLAALVVLTVDFRQGEDGPLATVQQGALSVFAPVQEGFATVVRPVGDFFSAIGQAGDLRDRNAELSEEIADLRDARPAAEDLERENAELRALLAMRERLDLDTVAAEVIGQPPGQVAFSLVINAGADQGLMSGMAVIDAQGLVGKLTEVTGGHARVELLSSPDARYAVRTAASGQTGLMQGQGARPFRLEIRDPSAAVDTGAQVVTRSFQGSTIPGGIPVGVIATDEDQPSPRYRAVRPYVDFSRLSVVQVVINAPGEPTELPASEQVTPPPRPRPRLPSSPEEAPEEAPADDPVEPTESEEPVRDAA